MAKTCGSELQKEAERISGFSLISHDLRLTPMWNKGITDKDVEYLQPFWDLEADHAVAWKALEDQARRLGRL